MATRLEALQEILEEGDVISEFDDGDLLLICPDGSSCELHWNGKRWCFWHGDPCESPQE